MCTPTTIGKAWPDCECTQCFHARKRAAVPPLPLETRYRILEARLADKDAEIKRQAETIQRLNMACHRLDARVVKLLDLNDDKDKEITCLKAERDSYKDEFHLADSGNITYQRRFKAALDALQGRDSGNVG